MSLAWEAISFLVYFQHQKGLVIKTLEDIAFHMKAVDTDARRTKTIGNVITILGTLAAPFTGGLSLLATGVGIAVNVTSTLGESTLIEHLVKKAQEEIEGLNTISKRIDSFCVDWDVVMLTINKTVFDAGIPIGIKMMLSTATREMLAKIPQECTTKILANFQVKMAGIFAKFSISATRATTTGAVSAITKQVSSEAAEQLGKQFGKKVILVTVMGVCFGVAIDAIDIVRIWKKGDPQALVQVQEVIAQLKEQDNPIN